MKVVILAGGFGTRLSEETNLKPKPMVEVGGKPILWHIMNIYAEYGFKEFVIALGYKGECIKEYFLNFYSFNNNISIDMATGETTIHNGHCTDWKVHLVDTGLQTQTGGRLRRLKDWLAEDETFMFTYGDGVADINLHELLEFHQNHGKLATVTTVRSPARFGRINYSGDQIVRFFEKSQAAEGWINGGYFVLNKEAIDYIDGDSTIWEREPIERLAEIGQLMGFRHDGFWSCMDTLKERRYLEEFWDSDNPPWKVWE